MFTFYNIRVSEVAKEDEQMRWGDVKADKQNKVNF